MLWRECHLKGVCSDTEGSATLTQYVDEAIIGNAVNCFLSVSDPNSTVAQISYSYMGITYVKVIMHRTIWYCKRDYTHCEYCPCA
jgi:hypothetical protein